MHCLTEAPSGFRLSFNDADYDNDNTNLGCRICNIISSADLAHMAKDHETLYRALVATANATFKT